jgi:hypothetical protein
LLASALDGAFHGAPPSPHDDGADHVADIVAAVAGDKRAVIDERRTVAQAQTRDRVRAASAAANAAAQTTAMPGELEDLGGDSAEPADPSSLPDKAELERLRGEVARRVAEMTRSMAAARDAAADLADKAKGATARGAADEATQLEKKADTERARMHSMLAELATLEAEVKELERAIERVGDLPPPPPKSQAPKAPPRATIDDQLDQLKRAGGNAPPPKPAAAKKPASTVDDELAALKAKMAQNAGAPPKKK